MKYQLAPLEGITTYVYRNAYKTVYGGIDEYFTPFIATHRDKTLSQKEINDINPNNNKNINLVPQILSNNAENTLRIEKEIAEYGYTKLNLNFGCPSSTVTTKKKGAGILRDLVLLEEYLDQIFNKTNMKISVKTRIGYTNYDDWEKIIDIYNKFPIEELIVHPRCREDFYNNPPKKEIFYDILKKYEGKISYNGNIFCKKDIEEIRKESNEKMTAIMIGRGIIVNPNLLFEGEDSQLKELEKLILFHKLVYQGYKENQSCEKNVLFRMKELWFYMSKNFEQMNKYEKEIKKAKSCSEYECVVSNIFSHVALVKEKGGVIF